jgi:hypothetical protein
MSTTNARSSLITRGVYGGWEEVLISKQLTGLTGAVSFNNTLF